jgi:hypothetical protein
MDEGATRLEKRKEGKKGCEEKRGNTPVLYINK